MDTEAVIKSLLESPDFAHLKKDVFDIGARKILIIEQCGLTKAREGRIEAEIKTDPMAFEFIDPSEKMGASRLYVDLASVSFGNVPNYIQFLAMPLPESSQWLEKAISINPGMFDWITEMAKAVEQANEEMLKALKGQETKKKSKPRKSASG